MAGIEEFERREPDNCNLIINFLPLSFKESDLLRVFQDVGPIKSVRIMKNRKTAKSKGYGFVKYERVEHANAAIAQYNGAEMMGKNIKVAFSRPGGTRTGCNLFVSNLPKKWTNDDFHIHFSEHGLLLECRVLKNNNNESRRCGFVRFDQAYDAQNAMKKMDGYVPNGAKSAINVKLAERPGIVQRMHDKKKHEKNTNNEWTTTTIDHNFYHQRQPPQHNGDYNMPNLNFQATHNPQVHSPLHVGQYYNESPYDHVQEIPKVRNSGEGDGRRNVQPESINLINNAPLSPMYNNLNMYSMPFSPLTGSSFPGGFSPSPPIPLQSPVTNFMFPTFDPCFSDFSLTPNHNNHNHNHNHHHPSPISPPAMTDKPFTFSQLKDALPTISSSINKNMGIKDSLSKGFTEPLGPSTLLSGSIISTFERDGETTNAELAEIPAEKERQPKDTVFVSNIPLFFDEGNLSNVFSQYGAVKIATLQHDNNGYSLGMGFVSYAHFSSAARAVKCLNGTTLYDRKICVRF